MPHAFKWLRNVITTWNCWSWSAHIKHSDLFKWFEKLAIPTSETISQFHAACWCIRVVYVHHLCIALVVHLKYYYGIRSWTSTCDCHWSTQILMLTNVHFVMSSDKWKTFCITSITYHMLHTHSLLKPVNTKILFCFMMDCKMYWWSLCFNTDFSFYNKISQHSAAKWDAVVIKMTGTSVKLLWLVFAIGREWRQ